MENFCCDGCIHATGNGLNKPSLDYEGCKVCLRNPYIDFNIEAVQIGNVFIQPPEDMYGNNYSKEDFCIDLNGQVADN